MTGAASTSTPATDNPHERRALPSLSALAGVGVSLLAVMMLDLHKTRFGDFRTRRVLCWRLAGMARGGGVE